MQKIAAILAVLALGMSVWQLAERAEGTSTISSSVQASVRQGGEEGTSLSSPVVEQLNPRPLAFTRNVGQWDERVLFRADAGSATMWFTRDGVYYQFNRRLPTAKAVVGIVFGGHASKPRHERFDRGRDSSETMMIKATFVGANGTPAVTGKVEMEYKCNYFLGNDPSRWHTDVPNYEYLLYEDVYPGIDLKYYGNGNLIEYDFIVSPGADPSRIQVHYDGARSLSINDAGELVVETAWGDVTELRPEVFQVDGEMRRRIGGEYVLLGDNTFSFNLGEGHDSGLPIVIDPVLSYSTYLGGSNVDNACDIVVDGNGNAYVAGYTWSTEFPTLDPFQTDEGECDVFVTKLSIDGNGLVYSTYLGGDDDDRGYGLAVDGNGNAYVTGSTASTDFPTLNPYQTDQGGLDAFVTKLSIDGNGLVYSTYLGGADTDIAYGMAVDSGGSAYVTGYTLSTDFPTANPYQTNQPYDDAFVAKLSSTGSGLVYSTYLGGGGNDYGSCIAVAGNGNAFVTGYTWSADFPTLNPYQTFQGGTDAFAVKLNTDGNGLVYGSYLGGGIYDVGQGIAVDGSGNAYVTGNTGSGDFPTLDPFQTDQPGEDIFVTKFSIDGNGLVYSTYLGGNGGDWGKDIAIDGNGNAYVTGRTESTDFPSLNPFQTDEGESDVVVVKLNSDGNAPIYSTYLGGNDYDWGNRVAVDSEGNAYVAGYTWSVDFPTVVPFDDSLGGSQDGFVCKVYSQNYLCGDADANDIVNISDAVYLITYIFGDGPEPQPLLSGDVDCNQIVNISDAVYLITYIFGDGPEPCADCR